MPFRLANSEIEVRRSVMDGKASADELPTLKATKAARDAEAGSRAPQAQEWREVNGQRLAVPHWVTEAEKRNPGAKYEFVEGFDRLGDRFSQWCLPAPPKSEALLASERFTGRQHRFDYVTRQYIDDHVPPAPPHIQRVMDMLEESDPRRPYFDPAKRQYVIRDQRPVGTLQDAPDRQDLVSPNGYPMTGRPASHHMGEGLVRDGEGKIYQDIPDGAGSVFPAQGEEETGGAAS